MRPTVNDARGADAPQDNPEPWWRRIQWFDVLLVILGVIVLLMLTFELWMPHNPLGRRGSLSDRSRDAASGLVKCPSGETHL